MTSHPDFVDLGSHRDPQPGSQEGPPIGGQLDGDEHLVRHVDAGAAATGITVDLAKDEPSVAPFEPGDPLILEGVGPGSESTVPSVSTGPTVPSVSPMPCLLSGTVPAATSRGVVALDKVVARYGNVEAVRLDRLELATGSLVALMGPNGSGKTTLLKLIAGLVRPAEGTITSPIPAVAYVSQHSHQRQWLPLAASEVLRMGRFRRRGLLGRLRRTDNDTLAEVAQRLEITDLLSTAFGDLSGGQQQRVLIAMALAQQAGCLLLDEPITGLDLPSQAIILEVMAAERDAGRLVVVSTHHLEEARACDRVVLVNRTIIADGDPHSVLQADALAAAFGQRLLTGVNCDVADHVHHPLLLDDHGHGH